ncbi:AAA family ATPase [Sedimentitalea sp. JM2-8]|uniref:AAA family ATPase n=1 Tax=Sedimentitalea xiamensis TaxID=3050037 RepID=A0ABT7FBY4_9RHOB|nr:AAA family ATPase [Sedimentitalea xiamensis]MDK3072570.1 AAA family ATPase [Sedimentitalea xiamensis]
MTDPISIILLSDSDAMNEAVGTAVAQLDGHTLKLCDGNLASVNGSAVQFLNAHDLLIFRVSDTQDAEVVRKLRGQVGGSGMLMALCDQDIPLSEARALKQAGVDEILPFPVARDELAEQIQRLATPRSMLPTIYTRPAGQPLGQIIGICPVRGGIGASTLAVNLADQLQDRTGFFRKRTRNRVAVVDLDLQFGSIATELDLPPSAGLYKMGRDKVKPDRTFLEQCLIRHDSGLEVLTAPDEFMPLDVFSGNQMTALIDTLRQEFDFVVVDLPRSLVDWLDAIVSACDRMLLVTDSTVPSIRQAYRLIDFFAQTRLEPPVEIVVGHEKKPLFKAGHHGEAEKVLGRALRYWLPHDPRHARIALDRGQLLSQAASGCALSKAIRAMSREILHETQAHTDERTRDAA